MPRTLIGVYWPARADDQETCANRAAEHFRLLRELGPGFDQWFHKAMRREETPPDALVDTPEAVRKMLSRGVNRRDTDNSVITELGWSLSLWNGARGNLDAQTRLHCGCTSKWVGNNAIVSVSRDEKPGLENRPATELLKMLVDLWDAETGKVVQSVWDEERQVEEEAEVATYRRRRWPLVRRKNAIRHAKGILMLAT